MELTDDELMRRVGKGDAAAFERLFARWRRPVRGMITRLIGSQGDADDLCQEVFIRVLRAAERYRSEADASAKFLTWVYRITINVVREETRRRKSRPRIVNEPDAPEPAAATTPDEMERRETEQSVLAAIAALPDALREALVLKHYSGLTFAEVAEALGLPVSTVKSRVEKGLREVRKEMKRKDEG